jgi:hypothetical protein
MPPPIAASLPDADTIKAITDGGPFAMGAVFGGFLSYFLFRLASSERTDRVKHEMEREKELLKQLDLKDKRIQELHTELAKNKPKALK